MIKSILKILFSVCLILMPFIVFVSVYRKCLDLPPLSFNLIFNELSNISINNVYEDFMNTSEVFIKSFENTDFTNLELSLSSVANIFTSFFDFIKSLMGFIFDNIKYILELLTTLFKMLFS